MVSAGSGLASGVGGMRTYYEGLIPALVAQGQFDQVVTFTAPGYDRVALPYGGRLREVHCSGAPSGRFGRVIYEQTRLPQLARRQAVDVLLSTVNVRPALWRRASVVVVQSLQDFFFPHHAKARATYLRVAMPRSLRGAHRVICVSEAARNDMIALFDIDPERLVTVHHGCSPWALAAAAEFDQSGWPPPPPPVGDRPYVLIVSSLYGLKNHRRLVEAFGVMLKRTCLPHELVIAGGDADVTRNELRAIARSAGVESRVRLLGRFPQEHLPALYANAQAVAYPSLYETFGHPVLEAFAFERPLLTSNVGGSAEIAGTGAVKVEPRSVDDIAVGLQQILEDTDLRAELVEAGRERLADFSWERCARQTSAVIQAAWRSYQVDN